jgi:hypothetical protein
MKTTYVRVTFGFDKNKFGRPAKFYRKGEGKNLLEAVRNLLRQRAHNYLPEDQADEVLSQLSQTQMAIQDGQVDKQTVK